MLEIGLGRITRQSVSEQLKDLKMWQIAFCIIFFVFNIGLQKMFGP